MKKVLFLIAFLLIFFFLVFPVLAAKKRVSRPTKTTTVTATQTQVRGVTSSVRLSSDHLSLMINFSGFDNIKSGSYELTYTGSGRAQGAGGSIILGDSSTKSLLFGTCSKGVCTYHTNVTNARLKITSNLKSGQKVIKTYRIKV